MKKLANKGFTLIEMLIVITIIGLLAAMVMRNLGDAGGIQARDAARVHSLEQIATWIGSMQTKYHVPPLSGGSKYPGVCSGTDGKDLYECFKFLQVASEDELLGLFVDPKQDLAIGGSTYDFGFKYGANKNSFRICAPLEDQGAFEKLNADNSGNKLDTSTLTSNNSVDQGFMYCFAKGPKVWDATDITVNKVELPAGSGA